MAGVLGQALWENYGGMTAGTHQNLFFTCWLTSEFDTKAHVIGMHDSPNDFYDLALLLKQNFKDQLLPNIGRLVSLDKKTAAADIFNKPMLNSRF